MMSGLLKTGATSPIADLVERGRGIYVSRLRDELEPENLGRFVAIEPGTGRYYLGDTGTEALVAARADMPEAQFYLVRIGHKAAHTIGGHASRIR